MAIAVPGDQHLAGGTIGRVGGMTKKNSAKGLSSALPRPRRVADDRVGRILLTARRQQRLALEVVSRDLTIPVRHLRALEEGDFSVFAAEVYARGAFTKYARYLGVDVTRTERAFTRALAGVREYVPLTLHSPRPWLAAVLTPRWILAGVILLGAVLLGSYIAWQVRSFWQLPSLTLTSPVIGVVSESKLLVTGSAAADARVLVNGEPTILAEDGTFEEVLVLQPGINVIHIEATNSAGRTRVVSKDVLLPRR